MDIRSLSSKLTVSVRPASMSWLCTLSSPRCLKYRMTDRVEAFVTGWYSCGVYRAIYAAVLRHLPPETAHAVGFWLIRVAARVPGAARLLRRLLAPRDPVLRVHALGLDFPGPLGLAAGFDKDGHGVAGLAALGFGFVEVGTVTARPQPGNPKPRMFRFPAERALVNRMGFNNAGAAALAARLRALRGRRGRPGRPGRPGSPGPRPV